MGTDNISVIIVWGLVLIKRFEWGEAMEFKVPVTPMYWWGLVRVYSKRLRVSSLMRLAT